MACPPRCPPRELEPLPGSDPHLLAHDVDSRHELRYRMLDLEPAVHFDEVEVAIRPDEELEGPGIPVSDCAAARARRQLPSASRRRRIEPRRGRLLDQLLVPPLDRAFALAERQDPTLRRRTGPGSRRAGQATRLLDVERTVAESSFRFGARGAYASLSSSSDATSLMPFPPPPADALSSTGKPASRADRCRSGRSAAPSEPGTRGGPARRRISFARTLSPICSTTSADGPMKTRSSSRRLVRTRHSRPGSRTRVDGLAPGGLGCGDDVRDQEVALSRRRRADADGLIRQLDVQSVAIAVE